MTAPIPFTKPVTVAPLDYSITCTGRVICHRTGREVLQRNHKGYRRVSLRFGRNKRKGFLVHRLVCLAFLGTPPTNRHEAVHIDSVKHHNHARNLKWATHAENMAMDRGNNHSHKGERNRNSKLTTAQVREIRIAYDSRKSGGYSERMLASRYGITTTHVGRIARRENGGWRHL